MHQRPPASEGLLEVCHLTCHRYREVPSIPHGTSIVRPPPPVLEITSKKIDGSDFQAIANRFWKSSARGLYYSKYAQPGVTRFGNEIRKAA